MASAAATARLPDAIAADREVGVALAAALAEVARDNRFAVNADDGAAGHVGDHVVGNERGPATGSDRHGDANVGLAHDIAGGGEVAQVAPPPQHDAGGGRVLDHVAGDCGVGLRRDSDAAAITRVGAYGAGREQVADDVAL